MEHRGARWRRTTLPQAAGAALAGAVAVALLAGPAAADTLLLPLPGAAQAPDPRLCPVVGCLPDRLLVSAVPGPVRSTEVVRVAVDPRGSAAEVLLEQRLLLSGRGDYQVRERGPARAARSLSDLDPPITKFGAVVWQGFSPGERELAAELTLDAGLEAARLPLGLRVSFRPAGGGAAGPLGPGGRLPGAGTVTLVLRNQTAQPATLPTATDADPAVLAPLLDRVRALALAAPGPRLPTAGMALPPALTVTGAAQRSGEVRVPLRVSGTLRVAGAAAQATGPGVTALPDGAAVLGTLSDVVTLTLNVDGPGQLALDLQASPVLDPRLLLPPGDATTWAAWAGARPPVAERVQALQQLVAAAAVGARAGSYSPYLGADLPGTGTTTFRYAFAAAPAVTVPAARPGVRPLGLGLTGVALALLLANGVLLWRRC